MEILKGLESNDGGLEHEDIASKYINYEYSIGLGTGEEDEDEDEAAMGVIRKKTATRGGEGGVKYVCDVCSADITSTVYIGLLRLKRVKSLTC